MSRSTHSYVACNTNSHRHVPISGHQQHNNGNNYSGSNNNNHLQNNNNNHVTRHNRSNNPLARGSGNDPSAYLPSQRFQAGSGGGVGASLNGPTNHRQPPHLHQHHHLIQNASALQQGHHNGAGGSSFAKPLVQDGDFPLRILVQSDMVGAIIGRSGSTIKQITQQSKARIDVHREETQDQLEKVITMNGSPESCSAACFKIMEIIINERIQLNKGACDQEFDSNHGQNVSSTESSNDDLLSAEVQLKILAHNNLIGRLIGRSGSSIKKIMEQTSTKINVSASSFSDCTHERTITVVGNLEQVCKAEQIISSKLRKAYMSDVSVSLQTVNQPPYLFNNLSYIPGPYAQNPILSTLVNTQPGSGAHPLSGRPMTTGGQQNHQIGGPPMYQGSTNYLSLYPNMSSGPGLLGFSPLPSLEVEKETVNIHIPNVMVGAIIGKSGSAIKEMILSSGASIRVAPATLASTSTSTNTNNNIDTATNESSTTKQTIHDENSNTNLPAEAAQEDGCQPVEVDSVEASSDINDVKSVVDKEEQIGKESTEVKKDESKNQPPNASPKQIGNDNSLATRKVTIVGTPEAQWSAQYLIYRKVSLENKKSDISLMVEIQVPSQLVGRIIGKGGATVKQIQKQTRATIRLPDEKPADPESDLATSVQIIGEFQCSQMAQRHIRNLMRDNHYSNSRQSKNELLRHIRNNNNNNSVSTSNNNSSNNNHNNSNNNNNNININNNIIESKSNAQANFIDNHRSDIESSSVPDEDDGATPIRSNEKSPGEIC